MSDEEVIDQENDADVGDDWGEAMQEQAAAEGDGSEASAEADWGEALQEQSSAEQGSDNIMQSADFPELVESGSVANTSLSDDIKLDVILDVPVTISMEIGRTQINIRNLLQLNQGSVVELDRLAGEPMDVLVNGTLIAHGEVVVVNEKFGIRLTDVISPSERVKRLG